MARFHVFIINLIFDGVAAVLRPVCVSLTAIILTGLGILRRFYRYRRDRLAQEEQIHELTNTNRNETGPSEAATAGDEEYFASESSQFTNGSESSLQVLLPCIAEAIRFNYQDLQQAEMGQETQISIAQFKEEMKSASKELNEKILKKFSQPACAVKKSEQSCISNAEVSGYQLPGMQQPAVADARELLLKEQISAHYKIQEKIDHSIGKINQFSLDKLKTEMQLASKALDEKISRKFAQLATAVKKSEQSCMDNAAVSSQQHPVKSETVTDARKLLPKERISPQCKIQGQIDHGIGKVDQKLQSSLEKLKEEMELASKSLDIKMRKKFPALSVKPKKLSYTCNIPKWSTTEDDSSDERPRRFGVPRGKRLRKLKLLSKNTEQNSASEKCCENFDTIIGSEIVKEAWISGNKEQAITPPKTMKPIRHVTFDSRISEVSTEKVPIISKKLAFPSSKVIAESSKSEMHAHIPLDYSNIQMTTSFSPRMPKNSEIVSSEFETPIDMEPSASISDIPHQKLETVSITSAHKRQEMDPETQADPSSLESSPEMPGNWRKFQLNRLEYIDLLLQEDIHSPLPQQIEEISDPIKLEELEVSGTKTSAYQALESSPGSGSLKTAESELQEFAQVQSLASAHEEPAESREKALSSDMHLN